MGPPLEKFSYGIRTPYRGRRLREPSMHPTFLSASALVWVMLMLIIHALKHDLRAAGLIRSAMRCSNIEEEKLWLAEWCKKGCQLENRGFGWCSLTEFSMKRFLPILQRNFIPDVSDFRPYLAAPWINFSLHNNKNLAIIISILNTLYPNWLSVYEIYIFFLKKLLHTGNLIITDITILFFHQTSNSKYKINNH